MALLDQHLEDNMYELAVRLVQANLQVVTAESCTGGLLAAQMTNLAGSSRWFKCGYITYSAEEKTNTLDVKTNTLTTHGAVSAATARAMTRGAMQRGDADLNVAITGVAGPGPDATGILPGTVWIAWRSSNGALDHALCYQFSGDREAVRKAAVAHAITGLLGYMRVRQSRSAIGAGPRTQF